ncbi:GGDEF domain-containing protein [Paenibacillus sp. JX-17]|uniref:GGDEF domain-containing protein n=2 Tax=Paenibacillus lacisoli TaxID=3064525 RepID=A0ABT9CDQ0_9BACL|nr:GGDEF domain-containing protein [Paenibacillus sp. JX-17]
MIILFPILVSIFHFRYSNIFFGLLFSLLTLGLANTLEAARSGIQVEDILVIILMQAGVSLILLGVVQHFLVVKQSLNQSVKHNESLLIQNVMMEYLNKTDQLTGLYNHLTFQEYLNKLIEQQGQNEFPIHLALLDVDNFKGINDTYGHRAGDLVLQDVSMCLQSFVKPNDFVARYGGEEFAIIFAERSIGDTLETLDNIRQSISDRHYPELENKAITVSIGIEEYAAGMGKEPFFSAADKALYTAKRTGKNKIVKYAEAITAL